jgi:hypothetical protein
MDSTWSEDELNFDGVLCDDEDDADGSDDEIAGPDPSSYSVYRRKYLLLLERSRAIQQDNELLVSRVAEVRRLERRGRRERRALARRLDGHGDNFRNVPLVLPAGEEGSGQGKRGKAAEKKLKKLEERMGAGRGRRKNKDKPPRDPNLPKRPQNPFFQYCKEKREVVAQDVFKNQNINLTKKELTKILANQWNSLDATAKVIYNERFEEEKAGYTVKMEVYRKLKEESEQMSLPSSNQLNLSASSFMSNYNDYEDSFD